MEKRTKIITGLIVFYMLSALFVLGFHQYFVKNKTEALEDKTEISRESEMEETEINKEEEVIIETSSLNTYSENLPKETTYSEYYVYTSLGDSLLYRESSEFKVSKEDRENLFSKNNLPLLERMPEEDRENFMSELQVLKRIEVLGVTETEMLNPEFYLKEVYNDSIHEVRNSLEKVSEEVSFEGSYASELNTFLEENKGKSIKLLSKEIILDEGIYLYSDTKLLGNNTLFTGDGEIEYAFLLEEVSNVEISGISLLSGFKEGIYIIGSDHIFIYSNEIANAKYKAICVMGDNTYVNIVDNSIHDNGNGAIFINGDYSHSIIQGNEIIENKGTRNLTAGIVFSAMPVVDAYNPYNPFPDEHLYDQLEAPNRNVIIDNLVKGNFSSGIYCDGGYLNYIVSNEIKDNEKEGMCFDYGSFGIFVYDNKITGNGDRDRQTDEDLEADFVLSVGRLEDGSSPYKLPGISLDNTAYNIIYKNTVSQNSGSGVKMVRSAYRNLVLNNFIENNGWGENENFHGFGVELGFAAEPDEPVIGLDFTADYENIISKNFVVGSYSSIFFMDGYCNDVLDNALIDADVFSVEAHIERYNRFSGNSANVAGMDSLINNE